MVPRYAFAVCSMLVLHHGAETAFMSGVLKLSAVIVLFNLAPVLPRLLVLTLVFQVQEDS